MLKLLIFLDTRKWAIVGYSTPDSSGLVKLVPVYRAPAEMDKLVGLPPWLATHQDKNEI